MKGQGLLLTASASCALTIFDTNLVGVILPSLVSDLGADFSQMAWVQSSFLLTFASLLLFAGAMADRYGRRRVLCVGLWLFGCAALACCVAPNISLLIGARAVQGVGAALLLAPALSTIGHRFRLQDEAIKAWSTWGSIMGLTMVIAPLLSSLAGYLLGWRWAFFVFVPICVTLILSVPRTIDEDRPSGAHAFDWAGAICFSLSMLLWVWGLINGPQTGWTSHQSVIVFTLGMVTLAAFVAIELRQANPMLHLRLFKSGRFVGAVIAMLGYAGAAQVMAALLPLYLQRGMGISFLWTGCALLPFAITMFMFPTIGRRLSNRLQSYQLLGVGLAIISVGNIWLALAVSSSNPIWFFIGMSILGAGGGLINGETQKAILGTVPKERTGMASGISTTARFFAMLVGYAGLSSVLAFGVKSRLQDELCASGGGRCAVLPDALEWVVTGRFMTGHLSMGELEAATALASYRGGFADLFLAAATVALLSAVLTVGLSIIGRDTLSRAQECSHHDTQ
ncbi:MFS transporter [Marinobacterium zhoushanense]|uniref:MFS transporter n=1 Tax=Marinobacterium zhoushanense TaxID=1679163 RepID=A0ABQ1K589_9GAMM|nr:MFS transporter [Marinobacterium zhoushanense]GGB85472.1 MFS transporter [Marinobacterium zhoushanense]